MVQGWTSSQSSRPEYNKKQASRERKKAIKMFLKVGHQIINLDKANSVELSSVNLVTIQFDDYHQSFHDEEAQALTHYFETVRLPENFFDVISNYQGHLASVAFIQKRDKWRLRVDEFIKALPETILKEDEKYSFVSYLFGDDELTEPSMQAVTDWRAWCASSNPYAIY
jgi:hypothetical protein